MLPLKTKAHAVKLKRINTHCLLPKMIHNLHNLELSTGKQSFCSLSRLEELPNHTLKRAKIKAKFRIHEKQSVLHLGRAYHGKVSLNITG